MSELIRHIEYNESGDPVLVIQKKNRLASTVIHLDPREGSAYRINLDDAWQFSEGHYPAEVPTLLGFDRYGLPVLRKQLLSFEKFMFFKTAELCEVLGLGEPTTRRMADIANAIESGLDDLLKCVPQPTQERCVGEIRITESQQGQGSRVQTNDLIVNVPVSGRN